MCIVCLDRSCCFCENNSTQTEMSICKECICSLYSADLTIKRTRWRFELIRKRKNEVWNKKLKESIENLDVLWFSMMTEGFWRTENKQVKRVDYVSNVWQKRGLSSTVKMLIKKHKKQSIFSQFMERITVIERIHNSSNVNQSDCLKCFLFF